MVAEIGGICPRHAVVKPPSVVLSIYQLGITRRRAVPGSHPPYELHPAFAP